VNLKLEVVVLPVSDVDRAKRFYATLGFRLDIDYVGGKNFRVVQLTPPRFGLLDHPARSGCDGRVRARSPGDPS
jgi:catechol 2,3-dioxygenase-like lactoylglutathione lyase family enzyme